MKTNALLTAALVVALVSPLFAQDLKGINEQMTKLGAQMMDLRGEISDEAEALEMEYRSGKHDTPEMKELRAKSDKLRQELIMVEKDLRGKFNALPAFSERVAAFEVKKAQYAKMRRDRQALFEKRKEIFKAAAAAKPAPAVKAAEKPAEKAAPAPAAKAAEKPAEKAAPAGK